MTYPSPPGVNYKIPIGAAIARAYRSVFGNFPLLVTFGWLPFVTVVAIKLVALAVQPLMMAESIEAFLLTLVFTIFAVRWHRFILLGETESNALFPPGWGPFLLACFKLALIVLGLSFVVVLIIIRFISFAVFTVGSSALGPLVGSVFFIVIVLFIALLVPVLLLTFRVCLAFPAAAIRRPISFRAAWNLLAGNYWRLLICGIACYLPFEVAGRFADAIGPGLPNGMFLFLALGLAITFVGVAVLTALLSDTYRGITDGARSDAGSAD